MTPYQKPAELYGGLRLHQNEHTGGCSPKVLEALARLTADQIAVYPPYSAAIEACARNAGVTPDELQLVNGLDEGILAVAIAFLRPRADGLVPEVIIPKPAFEVFDVAADVVGARVVEVAPTPDFSFPLDAVLAAITARTRAVIVTNPNNPTGTVTSIAAIKTLARSVPPGAVVFVDEAYIDFGGETFVPELRHFPNVVVGRTFSKAYGLAGLRAGLLLAQPDTLEPLRNAVPVYSINVAAAVAVVAAIEDTAHKTEYLRQTAASKELLYAACDRWKMHYWPSATNFVLVRTGDETARILAGTRERGIYLRDRSGEQGCANCIRITTGVLAHTERLVAAIEEILCAAR
ncbi:MAG: histidinol-phosphate transaminase [Vicinamibacterales bacterium]